jgi:NarL family two-component system sensor histidine kinase LiaS
MENSSTLVNVRITDIARAAKKIILRPFIVAAEIGRNIFMRLLSPFRRLSFKLSVAYLLSCAVTAFLFSALCSAIIYCLVSSNENTGHYFPYTPAPLAKDPVDLQRQVDSACDRIRENPLFLFRLDEQIASVTLVDGAGKVIASSGTGGFAPGVMLTNNVSSDEAMLVKAALNHNFNTAGSLLGSDMHFFDNVISGRLEDGRIASAYKVTDANNNADVVVALSSDSQFAQPPFLIHFVLLFTVFCSLLSVIPALIYGAVQGRRIGRRLNSLSDSVYSWSEGDFSQTSVRENSGDEIGSLARRLNKLPDGLQRQVATRQKVATLEERNRVARNLHDTVKQQAFALAMQLGAARTVLENAARNSAGTSAMTFVSSAEKLTNKIQEDLMAIIHDLKPANLSSNSVSFVSLMREVITDWSAASGIAPTIVGADSVWSSLEVQQELMLIVHEALANIARHSEASSVYIEIVQADDLNKTLTLTITDNGRGFDPLFARRGLGLYSMRDRANSLPGGKFALETGVGRGVTLRITCVPGEIDSNA